MTMNRIALVCLTLLRCAAAKPAIFDDLRALDKQQNYAELLPKLKEVPASSRDDEWEALAERATVATLSNFTIKDGNDGERALMTIDEQMNAFPSLKKSKLYLEKRAEVGAAAFKWTFSNYRHATSDEQWVPKVRAFVEKDTLTKGLAQTMAKDVVTTRLVASSAWPLYQLAFEREGDAVCADSKLVDVVLDVIDSESWLDEMTPLVTKRCAAQLKSPAIEKLKKNESRGFRKGACQVLAGQPDAAEALRVCQ
jgi:hypothetical protein